MSGSIELRAERLFFLERVPGEGPPRLSDEDERHAARVLRLGPGDELWGTDGRGSAWPLRVRAAGRSGLELEPLGAPLRAPRPGTGGGSPPWVEAAVALPRGGRAEEMLDGLVQLGLAALTPLVCERVQGPRRELSPARLRRLQGVARSATKQARRLWLPELRAPRTPRELLEASAGAALAVLEPSAPLGLLAWAREAPPLGARGLGTRERPIVVVAGPEGGLTHAEREELRAGGAREVRLGPHVLRVETAVEAALAGLMLAADA